MKKSVINLSVGVFAAVLVLAATIPVLARGMDDPVSNQDDSTTRKVEIRKNTERLRLLKERETERREEIKTRLTEVKLRKCQNREERINNIMARMANRGEKHLDVFTKIADRVKVFYETEGIVVDNYEELIAAIDTSKAEAELAIATVKGTSVEFKCDGTDPKGVSTLFKDSLKTQISTLKNYRISIKNLIVAVKSANNDQNQAEEGN